MRFSMPTASRSSERMSECVSGSVVEIHGDPSPWFYIVNIRVEEIGAP